MNERITPSENNRKFDLAFRILREKGYIALHNFLCCGGCASSEIYRRAKIRTKNGDLIRGAVYYHNQDYHNALQYREFYLGFGGYMEGTETTGRVVCDVLKQVGVRHEWNGTSEQRIHVFLD